MTRRHFGVRVPWLSRGDPCVVERAADPLNRAGVYSKPGSNLAHAISASRSRPMDGWLMWFSKGGACQLGSVIFRPMYELVRREPS
jgi:hypothetical protein